MFNTRKATLFFSFFFKFFLVSNAQDINVPQNALLSHLLRDSNQISRITISKDPIIPQPVPFSKNHQQLIKSNTGLYVFIDGTGRIYKVKNWDKNWVNFTRIDSTKFFGFNKGSQKFISQDTIFSFGGYGFWHFNGSLSYFTAKKEWEMLPLNMEIPYYEVYDRISSISQYDFDNGVFYFSAITVGQQTVVNAPVNDSFYAFNFHKRQVQSIGKIVFSRPEFIRFCENRKVQTPLGLLMDCPFDDNKDYLFNIKDNQIFTSDNRIMQQLISSSNYASNNLLFYQNGYLYSTTFPFDKLDSLKFDFSKFKLLNRKIYETYNVPSTSNFSSLISKHGLTILLPLLFILSIVLVFFVKRKNKEVKVQKIQDNVQIDELLSPLENQLLKQFISIIDKNQRCSTDELNNMLGVGLKTTEIKKKARTDFITKVNYKLKQHFSMSEDVIIRTRSEDDKRSYLYSVSPTLILKIKKLLN